jgi:transposase
LSKIVQAAEKVALRSVWSIIPCKRLVPFVWGTAGCAARIGGRKDFSAICDLRTGFPKIIRAIRELVDAALRDLSRAFAPLYAREGRPSIPPERLSRALLLQAFYTVRSERQLMEQLNYKLLFRWFVGLSADDPVWDATVFCKNRDRLLDGDIAAKFFTSVLNVPQVRKLLSSEHFSVDGTLIEAWATMKSFVSKDARPPKHGNGGRNAGRDFHGEKRKNDTHASPTDPDARLMRKGAGKEAKLCRMG